MRERRKGLRERGSYFYNKVNRSVFVPPDIQAGKGAAVSPGWSVPLVPHMTLAVLDGLTGERGQFSLQVTHSTPSPLAHEPAPRKGTRYPGPDQPERTTCGKPRSLSPFNPGIICCGVLRLVRQESRAVQGNSPAGRARTPLITHLSPGTEGPKAKLLSQQSAVHTSSELAQVPRRAGDPTPPLTVLQGRVLGQEARGGGPSHPPCHSPR